jgi:CheY-like chemotaxis protein
VSPAFVVQSMCVAMRQTILVVDDNRDIRDTLAIALGDKFSVVCASNGKEALELLLGGLAPRLVILDLNMPEMNGWELIDALEAHPELKGIEVLVLSSTPTLSDARRPHLGKYTSLESLIATIEATLQRAA